MNIESIDLNVDNKTFHFGNEYPVINDYLYPLINTNFRIYFLDTRWHIIKIAHWLIKPPKQIPNASEFRFLRNTLNTWAHEGHEGTGLGKTEQNRTDCLFDINHTVSSQSYIHITQ